MTVNTPQTPDPAAPIPRAGASPLYLSEPSLPIGYRGDTAACALCGHPAPAVPVPGAGRLPGVRDRATPADDVAGGGNCGDGSAPLCQPCLETTAYQETPLTRRQRVTATFLVRLDVDIDPVDGEGHWRGDDAPRVALAEDISDELHEHLAYQTPEPGDLVQGIHGISTEPSTSLDAMCELLDRVQRHAEELPAIQAAIAACESPSGSQAERAFDAREAHYAAGTSLLHELVAALETTGLPELAR